MAKKSKDKLAQDAYGYDFDELDPGEKAGITRKFNAQKNTRSVRTSTSGSSSILAKIGRSGNGVHECVLEKNASVAQLIKQGKFSIDSDKEAVIAQSTGLSVDLTDKVKSGEIYIITPEIRSA